MRLFLSVFKSLLSRPFGNQKNIQKTSRRASCSVFVLLVFIIFLFLFFSRFFLVFEDGVGVGKLAFLLFRWARQGRAGQGGGIVAGQKEIEKKYEEKQARREQGVGIIILKGKDIGEKKGEKKGDPGYKERKEL